MVNRVIYLLGLFVCVACGNSQDNGFRDAPDASMDPSPATFTDAQTNHPSNNHDSSTPDMFISASEASALADAFVAPDSSDFGQDSQPDAVFDAVSEVNLCADVSCDDGNECTADTCAYANCSFVPVLDGTACSDGNGQCHQGSCCVGCWDGSSCQQGTTVEACGLLGARCGICSETLICAPVSCVDGTCVNSPINDGYPCPGGYCEGAICIGICGQNGAVCCDKGPLCASGLTCSGGLCQKCGARDQQCCSGTSCSEGECVSVFCRCGNKNELCCIGDLCDQDSTCTDGVCL